MAVFRESTEVEAKNRCTRLKHTGFRLFGSCIALFPSIFVLKRQYRTLRETIHAFDARV